MKTWNKTISLLCNDEQQIVANGYPDLRVNGVLGCSVEGLNMQMLFDPFEDKKVLGYFRKRSAHSDSLRNHSLLHDGHCAEEDEC